MKTKNKPCPCAHCGAPNTLRQSDGLVRCLTCDTNSDAEPGHPSAMSPEIGNLLVQGVIPRLQNLVRTIPKVGHEDDEEIIQDCTLQAARMMVASTKAGHPITAGNASYFAVKAARSGRRSYYTGRSDVLSPGCQIDGKARHEWLDQEIEMEFGDVGTLHDVVAPYGYQGSEPDPAEEAARNLDWEAFLASSPERFRVAIEVLLSGGTMREAGQRCGLKDSAALNLKRRIAASLVEFFGEDVIRRLLDGIRPCWESNLQAARERAYRSEETFQPQVQPVS